MRECAGRMKAFVNLTAGWVFRGVQNGEVDKDTGLIRWFKHTW